MQILSGIFESGNFEWHLSIWAKFRWKICNSLLFYFSSERTEGMGRGKRYRKTKGTKHPTSTLILYYIIHIFWLSLNRTGLIQIFNRNSTNFFLFFTTFKTFKRRSSMYIGAGARKFCQWIRLGWAWTSYSIILPETVSQQDLSSIGLKDIISNRNIIPHTYIKWELKGEGIPV